VEPGSLGENITTRGVDLLELPVGTRLRIGEATVVVTGLRNPCRQIDDLQPGLMKRLVFKDDDGHVRRLAGVMGIVARGGVVRPGDQIIVDLPPLAASTRSPPSDKLAEGTGTPGASGGPESGSTRAGLRLRDWVGGSGGGSARTVVQGEARLSVGLPSDKRAQP
jgi:hypothetical protein